MTVLGPAKPTSLILFQADLTSKVVKIVDFGLGSLKPGVSTTTKKLCTVKDRALLAAVIPAVQQELGSRLSEHLVTRGMDQSSHSYLTPRQASDLLRLSLSSVDFRKIVAMAGLLWFGGKDAQKFPWILLAKIENYPAVLKSDEWLVGAVNAVCSAKGSGKRILRAIDLLPGFWRSLLHAEKESFEEKSVRDAVPFLRKQYAEHRLAGGSLFAAVRQAILMNAFRRAEGFKSAEAIRNRTATAA